MIGTKIWERYFLRETLKVFLLFILCFYGLYILIDYTSHTGGSQYYHTRFSWTELGVYYLCEFVKRADVLIPFALLLATIRTLCNLNMHNELIALFASGIKVKTLLRPFVFVGLFFTALLFLNSEVLQPKALNELKHLSDKHASLKNKKKQHLAVQHVALEDGSRLLFQNYDTTQQRFFDAYWIRSIDEVYRIKYLYPYEDLPTGHYVDHLVRNANGLEHQAAHEMMTFPEMHFNKKTLLETITHPDDQSLSELWGKMADRSPQVTDKEAQVSSFFYHKMAKPWLCLLAVIGPAPFCLRISRNLPIFFIYAFSIFALVAFHLAMEAALVLGKRQVMNPAVAIWPPFALFSVYCLVRYFKLK